VERRRLCVFFLYLALAVMKKCCDACGDGEYYFLSSCLASEGAGVSGASSVLTGSRWDIRWLSGRGKTPTFCAFPAGGVAVMEKCCDVFGDGEYYFRSSCLASEDAGVSGASIVVDQKSMGHTVAERSWKDADFVCISVFSGGYGKVL
jgi:cytochrome c5